MVAIGPKLGDERILEVRVLLTGWKELLMAGLLGVVVVVVVVGIVELLACAEVGMTGAGVSCDGDELVSELRAGGVVTEGTGVVTEGTGVVTEGVGVDERLRVLDGRSTVGRETVPMDRDRTVAVVGRVWRVASANVLPAPFSTITFKMVACTVSTVVWSCRSSNAAVEWASSLSLVPLGRIRFPRVASSRGSESMSTSVSTLLILGRSGFSGAPALFLFEY